MKIPEKLKIRLQNIGLNEDVYDTRARKCILSRENMNLERVPWYKHAYFIGDDFRNKKDSFVFDPVSIVPCIALNPEKNDKILDMCAAPGTKTFIISFFTNNEAHIISNDIDRNRVKRLVYNVNKFNISSEVTNISGRTIEGYFDKILLDATCSGEGMINKKEKLFKTWNEKRIKFLSKKQKKLILHAFDILEENGTLVYSTCTFEPEENEMVVDFLLNKRDDASIEKIDVDINHVSGITNYNDHKLSPSLASCVRIYPQHNNTGGFFVAKIRKTKSYLSNKPLSENGL